METIFKIILMVSVFAIIGFGASLSTTPTLDRIGGDNNNSIPGTNADVTKITLNEVSSNINSATVTVKNTDSVAHTFELCMITKDGALFSDSAGTVPDCVITSSISANSTSSVTINFSNPLTAAGVDAASLSIEETV